MVFIECSKEKSVNQSMDSVLSHSGNSQHTLQWRSMEWGEGREKEVIKENTVLPPRECAGA